MTGPVTTEALVDQIARILDPDAHHLGLPDYYGPELILAGASARVRVARKNAGAILAGPLAPLLAAHQQVTAERDEDRAEDERFAIAYTTARGAMDYEHMARVLSGRLRRMDRRAAAANRRADAAEASLATATSELALLRAEGEAKDRALKVALDAYDAAVRESANAEAVRQDVLGRQGDHPDIGEIMDQVGAEEGCMRAVAARGIARADLVAAVRTALARAATAREGA